MTKSKKTTAEIYEIAWKLVFDSLPVWKQKEINRFVKSGQINNRFYLEFIDKVISVAEENE